MSSPITQDAVARAIALIKQTPISELASNGPRRSWEEKRDEAAAVILALENLTATQSLSEWRDSPELVERVARGIYDATAVMAQAEGATDITGYDADDEDVREFARTMARAALSALPPGSVKP